MRIALGEELPTDEEIEEAGEEVDSSSYIDLRRGK